MGELHEGHQPHGNSGDVLHLVAGDDVAAATESLKLDGVAPSPGM